MFTAWHIIVHNKKRFLLSSAGIAIAVIVMFVEQGFYNGVINSQILLSERINGDIVVIDKNRTHLNKWNTMSPNRLYQIRSLESIETATPVYKTTFGFKNKQTEQIKRMIVYGFPADTKPFNLGENPSITDSLKIANSVIFDSKSRSIFGAIDKEIEMNNKTYRVAGFVDIGPNIIVDGAVFMGQGQLLTDSPRLKPIMFVLRLKNSEDVTKVLEEINQKYHDLNALTPKQLSQREVEFITTTAPVGIIFGIGMVAGFIIGMIICYQVLYNEINDLLPQYATLKAMGFAKVYLMQLIISQALILALGGFLIAIPMVYLVFQKMVTLTQLPIYLEFNNSVLLFLMTLVMCIASGFLAMRKVNKLDPAELF